MHSMTAHMDAVTGLAVDPHGLYLLSGSESTLEWEEGEGLGKTYIGTWWILGSND